jgi:disulfide oxidoreductase YuzD
MSPPEHIVVISQPMYFPWVGMLEQMALSDTFIFYDDVQFSRGGVLNRVQIKVDGASRWLTVPLKDQHLGQMIDQVSVDDATAWRKKHLASLAGAYRKAPYRADMLAIVEEVLGEGSPRLADVTMRSMLALGSYFGILDGTRIMRSSELGIDGRNSIRVRDVCLAAGATRYATGHGARNYLDHEDFALHGIHVEYMDYKKLPYPQLGGEFTPYVSALDLVANCGRAGASVIRPSTVAWQEVMRAEQASDGTLDVGGSTPIQKENHDRI